MAKAGQPEFKKVITPVFRGSFLALAAARAQKNEDGSDGKEKFGLSAIWTPDKFTEADKKRWAAMIGILDEAARAGFNKSYKDLSADLFKKGLRKGDGKEEPGYGPGTIFCSLTSTQKPGIVDKDGAPMNPADLYSGAYFRATVHAYSFKNKSKGVALGLNNLQFVAHGERLDNRASAAEDFGDDQDMGWMTGEAGSSAGADLDL